MDSFDNEATRRLIPVSDERIFVIREMLGRLHSELSALYPVEAKYVAQLEQKKAREKGSRFQEFLFWFTEGEVYRAQLCYHQACIEDIQNSIITAQIKVSALEWLLEENELTYEHGWQTIAAHYKTHSLASLKQIYQQCWQEIEPLFELDTSGKQEMPARVLVA